MNIVIIGNGIAGIEAALTVREREPTWTITIVSEESDHFFSRTALMWVHTGQLSHRCIEPLERDVYERLNFRRVRARAVGIDTEARSVHLAGGLDSLPFDRLLIATGSRPRSAPWTGAQLAGIGHFVTHQDLAWFEHEVHGGCSRGGPPPNKDAHMPYTTEDSPYRERSSGWSERGGPPKHPVVIGGGLIGIEAVEVLCAAGIDPKFFIREDWFWPIALDPNESSWIAERMRQHGVDVRLGENVEGFAGNDRVQSLSTDKEKMPCDLAVVAIGVVPQTDWLTQNEAPYKNDKNSIQVDDRGGVIVDDRLQTNVEGIFAAGDCAVVRWFTGDRRPEQLWYTGRDQGRIAGRGLLQDQAARYDRGQWYNSAKLMDIEYTTAGLVNMNVSGEENWFHEETGSVRSTTRITLAEGRVVGFNCLGRRWDHTIFLRWIEEHRPLAWVLQHLNEARFDTEFVPPLVIAKGAQNQPLAGPASSKMRGSVTAPAV